MESISNLNKTGVTIERKVGTNFKGVNRSSKKAKRTPAADYLIAEGGETFFHYLKSFGLDNEPNMLVLSSKNHYYYDYSEFEDVTTLVNLKKLNLIKHLDSFIQTVCGVLSPETNFIGCFSDRKTQKDTGLASRLYKRFINFLDSRTDMEIDKKDVSRLLELRGYKVIDMTEINGLTYFRTQNLGQTA